MEYGVTISGALTVELGDEEYIVEEGGIQYGTTTRHLMRNDTSTSTRAVWINLSRL